MPHMLPILVLKHAGATELTLQASHVPGSEDGNIIVEVTDNGRGIGDSTGVGRGLPNMRHRASAIGAIIDIRRTASGTSVRLKFPVELAQEKS